MLCEDTDFMFPMLADIYFPIVTQGEYGQPKKDWVFDRTIVCNVQPFTAKVKEDVEPNSFLQNQNKLTARTKYDPRISSEQGKNAITNILITNIRYSNNTLIYKETAGVRAGRGTIYEVATVEPFMGPFQTIEYYSMVWRRAENQTVGD